MSSKRRVPSSRCDRDGHNKHLCILTDYYFHTDNAEKYRALVKNPKFKCQFCGRTAKSDKNLCYPKEL